MSKPLIEAAKKIAERTTGWRQPAKSDLDELLRKRKARALRFKDDGLTPNHPRWPLVLYRSPVVLTDDFDPAAIFENLFERNGWHDSWRAGIYDFLHYHSRIHEVLGIARGRVRVRFGGAKGRAFELKAGDIAILPAGTGHQCLGASDLLVVGAYPAAGTYDECRPNLPDHDRAVKTIPKVPRPKKDPVYGSDGPLLKLWR
jgi:uncharacterized protein YjlB